MLLKRRSSIKAAKMTMMQVGQMIMLYFASSKLVEIPAQTRIFGLTAMATNPNMLLVVLYGNARNTGRINQYMNPAMP